MSEVALIVKKKLNESYESSVLKKFIEYAQALAKKDKKYYEIHFIINGKHYDIMNFNYDGTFYNRINYFSDLSDENIYGKQFYEHDDIVKVLKGNKPSWANLKKQTAGNKFSCLVLVDWKEVKKDFDTEVIAGVFIKDKGTAEILNAFRKAAERKKNNKVEIDTSNDPRKWTSANWKDVFSKIKKVYADFKKERGDKAALIISDLVNRMSTDPDVLATMSKLFGYKIEKDVAVKMLYIFLLDGKHYGWLDPLFKDKHFADLYKQLHPNKNI